MEERDDDKVRAQIRSVVLALRQTTAQLEEIHADVPFSPREEIMFLGEEDWDFPTEVRTAIECVVQTQLTAAIEQLAALAEYRPGSGEENGCR
jgi:hypothetical protein